MLIHSIVWIESNKTCHYCELELFVEAATEDHVVPRAEGGRKTLIRPNNSLDVEPIIQNNVVISCGPCNREKGSGSYEDFLKTEWLTTRRRLVKEGRIQAKNIQESQLSKAKKRERRRLYNQGLETDGERVFQEHLEGFRVV